MRRTRFFLSILTLAIGLIAWVSFNIHFSLAQEEQRTYVGVDRCKTCHPKNHEAYIERKFSKGWSVLEMRGKTKDQECLKCHTTGFGQPTGYVSEEATPHLKYKQCESCHGPGSIHAGNPADAESRKQMAPYKYGSENICIKCHVCMKTHKEAAF